MEDEWERELESEKDPDLLFVKYKPATITVEQLLEKINQHGFKAELVTVEEDTE